MNPAIAEALAALVLSIHSAPTRKGDTLCVALGLDADASWDDVAAALRALARPDVGLPEGWTLTPGVPGESYPAAQGPRHIDRAWATRTDLWAGPGAVCIPIPVAAVLLRAAGVAS